MWSSGSASSLSTWRSAGGRSPSARYSSDLQSAASIDDQFRVCREHAERSGWTIAGGYRDAAASGASVILRPGIQAPLEDARRGAFDIVVAEALDRVSRDLADVAALFKHLQFAGVMIVTLAEGEISELNVGLKGTMNALFLKDLAAKTHRGLRGRVEQGRSGGYMQIALATDGPATFALRVAPRTRPVPPDTGRADGRPVLGAAGDQASGRPIESKYSRVTLNTIGASSSSPIRFGTAISPLRVSARFQTRLTFTLANVSAASTHSAR